MLVAFLAVVIIDQAISVFLGRRPRYQRALGWDVDSKALSRLKFYEHRVRNLLRPPIDGSYDGSGGGREREKKGNLPQIIPRVNSPPSSPRHLRRPAVFRGRLRLLVRLL